MDYEERMIDGVQMVAFQGCWYPLYEDEPDYDEKVEDGMVMVLVNGHWYPVTEAVQDNFPFADLTDYEFLNLYYDHYECDDKDMDYYDHYESNMDALNY